MDAGELSEYFIHLHGILRRNDQLEYALSIIDNSIRARGPALALPVVAPIPAPIAPIAPPIAPIPPPLAPAAVIHRCTNPRCRRKGTRIGPGNCTGCGTPLAIA